MELIFCIYETFDGIFPTSKLSSGREVTSLDPEFTVLFGVDMLLQADLSKTSLDTAKNNTKQIQVLYDSEELTRKPWTDSSQVSDWKVVVHQNLSNS